MIFIGNIKDVKEGQYDQTFAIVRSYKGKQGWIKQMSELSPSWDLFMKYRDLVDKNQWNRRAFQEIYVPQFLREMHEPLGRESLNFIYRLSKAQNIALICFCTDEDVCHRSIVAGLLQGVGANVVLPSGKNYSHYFQQYQNGG